MSLSCVRIFKVLTRQKVEKVALFSVYALCTVSHMGGNVWLLMCESVRLSIVAAELYRVQA